MGSSVSRDDRVKVEGLIDSVEWRLGRKLSGTASADAPVSMNGDGCVFFLTRSEANDKR